MAKILIGLALIGVTVVAAILTRRIFIYPAALGFILLLWGIGSGGNKSGYNF